MNTLMGDFGIGVVSGVLSVAVAAFFSEIWKKILEPWYEERLYKGPEISGTWEARILYADGDRNEIAYHIRRKGHNATGQAHCTNGPEKGETWLLSGTFKDLILNLSYISSNKNKLDQGGIVLILANNGGALIGFINYYSYDHNCIKSAALELHRAGVSERLPDVKQ